MVGVDHHDQMMTYYGFSKKSMKWYKKLFFHLISMTTVNAHIVYNKVRVQHGHSKVTMLQFLEELIKDLAMETTQKMGQKQDATSSTQQGPASRLIGRHFMSRLPGDHHKSCVVCNQKAMHQRDTTQRKYKRSSFWCECCGVTLCNVPCFEEYHTIREYWK
uniref:PiggyBac transposable element-derived protein domain-containing protein n=1 Tax=Ciona savignyi TaxID=51511 RepID=H2YZK6_CIOSA